MKKQISKSEYKKMVESVGFKVRFKTISFQDLARKDKVFPIIKDPNGLKLPTIFKDKNHLGYW